MRAPRGSGFARRRRLLTAGLAAALALLALGAACGPTRRVLRRDDEPWASVAQMGARSFDRQRADLSLQLEVENPGAALALTAADYEILAQGRSFAVGTVKIDLPVPASGRSALVLPIQLSYLDLPYAARGRFKAGQPVQLVARGTLRGTVAGGAPATVEFDGEAEVGLTFGAEAP